MRIAQAQMNPTLGDFESNAQKILSMVREAQAQACDLVIFPESALFGYLPIDMLEYDFLVKTQLKVFKSLQSQIPKGIAVMMGVVTEAPKTSGKAYYNSAALIQKGRKTQIFNKELLPSYDIFDEGRFFAKGDIRKNVFKLKSKKFLVTICEDIWAWGIKDYPSHYNENPILKIKEKNFDAIINLSASPFYAGKLEMRYDVVSKLAKRLKAPVFYTNMVGAQDEVIFDGASFVMNQRSQVVLQAPRFEEALQVFELETANSKLTPSPKKPKDNTETNFGALALGIRDFVRKTGFQKVHLGLSGGIDSAVVVCLAVEALGAENVCGIALPGPYNSPESLSLAQSLAKNLNIKMLQVPIQSSYETLLAELKKSFGAFEFGVTNENLQSRLRGSVLMAYSNTNNSLLLTTGNKSELATGYATLYGDMCGALNPLGDLLKYQVYDLARLINTDEEIIPDEIITRPPSAELRPNQKDQDSLPPYNELDKAVQNLIEKSSTPKSKTELWLQERLSRTEFKRWQAPPILKVSAHSFGRGRRMPIAAKLS